MDKNQALQELSSFVNYRVTTLFDASSDPRVFTFAREIEEKIQSLKDEQKS